MARETSHAHPSIRKHHKAPTPSPVRKKKHASRTRHEPVKTKKESQNWVATSTTQYKAANSAITGRVGFVTPDKLAKSTPLHRATSNAKAVVPPATDARTTLIVSPNFSIAGNAAPQSTDSTTPTLTLMEHTDAIPATPALLSLPILSLPSSNLVPFLVSPTPSISAQGSMIVKATSVAVHSTRADPVSLSSSLLPSHSSSSSDTAHSQSPPAVMIASIVGSCLLLFVFGPLIVIKLIKFRRNRALVSMADLSPGIGGSKSFGSPIWGPALEKTISSDTLEENHVASMFPRPPKPFAKQKLHPDIRMHIGKPHPLVLPDFVSASYRDELPESDYLNNDRTYERGQQPQPPKQEERIQPQLSITGPTPSTSAASDFSQKFLSSAEENAVHLPKQNAADRTASYINFEDHRPTNGAQRREQANKKSNLKMSSSKKSAQSPSSTLQVQGRKQPKKYRSEDERRARDTKALTSALGLSSPPSPSMYSPSLNSPAPEPKAQPKQTGKPLPTVMPTLTVRSPTAESLSPMGRYMLGEYQDDHPESDIDNDGVEYRINPSPSPNTMSLTETNSNTGAIFDLIDTKARLKKRLSGISEGVGFSRSSGSIGGGYESNRTSRDVSSGYAMMPDAAPRLPSPPPIPSLEQLALTTDNPDYRSPTYSLYGLYNEARARATSTGTSFYTSGMGDGKKSFYPPGWKS